jgi:hypothetical protein
MSTPTDVNVPGMRQVYGHVLRADDPLLGDNPKVAALLASKFFTGEKPESKMIDQDKLSFLMAIFKMVIEALFKAPKED